MRLFTYAGDFAEDDGRARNPAAKAEVTRSIGDLALKGDQPAIIKLLNGLMGKSLTWLSDAEWSRRTCLVLKLSLRSAEAARCRGAPGSDAGSNA